MSKDYLVYCYLCDSRLQPSQIVTYILRGLRTIRVYAECYCVDCNCESLFFLYHLPYSDELLL